MTSPQNFQIWNIIYFSRYVQWKWSNIFLGTGTSSVQTSIMNLLDMKEKLNYKELKVWYSTINEEHWIGHNHRMKSIQMFIIFEIIMVSLTTIEKNHTYAQLKWFFIPSHPVLLVKKESLGKALFIVDSL